MATPEGWSAYLNDIVSWTQFRGGVAPPEITYQGSWGQTGQSAAPFGAYGFNSTNAQNDSMGFLFNLAAGTWSLDWYIYKRPDCAQVTVEFSQDNGTTWTNIATGTDLYAASAIGSWVFYTGIVVPKSGRTILRLRNPTRNASATGWFLDVCALNWRKTA